MNGKKLGMLSIMIGVAIIVFSVPMAAAVGGFLIVVGLWTIDKKKTTALCVAILAFFERKVVTTDDKVTYYDENGNEVES